MAKAAVQKKVDTQDAREDSADGPLQDSVNAAVKKMIAQGKEKGYVTYDDLNNALPPDQVSSEQIEDTMSMLSKMGVNVVESEDGEEAPAATEKVESPPGSKGNVDEADLGRTDDPVRMYLREMGSVELLSREGEIAIAKRIEAGREMMIGGICENPLTIRAIVQWHDSLVAEEMLLRDIIDLDATQGGGPGQAPGGGTSGKDQSATEAGGKPSEESKEKAAAGQGGNGKTLPGANAKDDDDEEDDEDEEQNLSLAALEAKLTPEVVETFEKINKTYKKLHKIGRASCRERV